VQVHFLRQKIDARFGRSSLESVRGVGYRIRAS
jgi:DNA-binding response OmpR family regulator